MNKKQNKAFTLVELIVVITILAILGTIAFLSFQGYSKTARDSRRTSDISNIKTALELFILNTGKYPLPDNGEEVSYSGDILWTQGTVGNNVTTNLSKTLKTKPLDPLLYIEYTYSALYSKKEYQVMALYEGELSQTNDIINTSYAANNYNIKIEGTYNEIFVKSQRFIVPTPSIINAEVDGVELILSGSNIQSQVITGGTNFPKLNIPNTIVQTGALEGIVFSATGTINSNSGTGAKISVIDAIQNAYTGATSLANKSIYKNILDKTSNADKILLADVVLLNKPAYVALNTTSTICTSGQGFNGTSCVSATECTTGLESITLANLQTWSCMNLGATIVWDGTTTFTCTSMTDCSNKPNWAGDYYQWGRNDTGWINGQSGWNYDWQSPQIDTAWGGSTSDTATADGAGTTYIGRQGPCPTGWHVPSIKDWHDFCNQVIGTTCTSAMVYNSAISSVLKLPFTGLRTRNMGYYQNQSSEAYYWSSSPNSIYSHIFYFYTSGIWNATSHLRAWGDNIRCLKN